MKIKFRFSAIIMLICMFLFTTCDDGGSSNNAGAGGEAIPAYSVTYDANEAVSGDVPVDSTKYQEGMTVTIPGNTGTLEREGYTFTGWNTEADGSGVNYTQGQTFDIGSEDVTLYAKWTADSIPTYSVTYDANEAGSGDVPVDSTGYEEGASVTVPGNTGNLEREGYIFTGWNTEADGSGNNYTQGQTFDIDSEDVTLYAKWTADTIATYSVTYEVNGADSGEVPVDSTCYEEGASVTVPGNTGNLVRKGFTFTGWNTKADGSGENYTQGQSFDIGTEDVTLYANWTAVATTTTYTVTYNANGAGSGDVPVDSTEYEEGNSVTVLGNTGTLEREGYTFTGWNTEADGSGVNYTQGQTFDIGSEDVTLYANWTEVTTTTSYTVTYNANGADSGDVPVDSTEYEEGASVTVPDNTGALEKAEYTFTGWNTKADGSGVNYTTGQTFTIGSENVVLYANWTAVVTVLTYTVTYDANEAVSGDVPVDSTGYEEGSSVIVPCNTGNLVKDGYTFTGWNAEADGSGENYTTGQTFAMGTVDVILYANWKKKSIFLHTVTYDANGADSGEVPVDNTSYKKGDTVTVAGNTGNLAREGYTFAGWNTRANGKGDNYPSEENGNTFTMGGFDETLYANWTEVSATTYTVTYDANNADSGDVPVDSTNYNEEADVTVSDNTGGLVREGYTFTGWNKEADGSGDSYTPGQTFTIGSEDVILYANWTAENTNAYNIGDTGPAGGVIFYVKESFSDGWQYLEVAPSSTEWSDIEWGSYGTHVGGTQSDIGKGMANTAAIVEWLNNNDESDRAAQLCDNLNSGGSDDWFLPSEDELELMYNNLSQEGIGNFSDEYYWSSTECSTIGDWLAKRHARALDFGDGSKATKEKKNKTFLVRAIRAF